MNIDAIRRLLTIAEIARDPYAVAQVAGALLAANLQDAQAIAHYARALGELQLFCAAQQALGTPQTTAGLLPWTSRARRFNANLRALALKDPAGAVLVSEAAKQLSAYELHQSGDGNFQVRDKSAPHHAGWIGILDNHKQQTAAWQFDAGKTPIPAPIAFHGLGFGWLFMHVLATTRKTYVNYSCAVHIMEGDPLAIAMLFHMHDLRETIASPRTHWYVRSSGELALRDFREAVSNDHTLSVPQQIVRAPLRPVAALPVEQALQELTAARNARRDALSENANAYYFDKDASSWARRFDSALSRRGEKLRILGITSRHTTVLQYSMAEMHASIQANFGDTCDMQIAIEDNDHTFENPFLEMIAEYKPDLIFQLSRLRYENPWIPQNVPFLCWDQDSLPGMRTREATAGLSPLTYVAGHGAVFGFTTLQWPRWNCIFVHPAGATFRYRNEPVDAAMAQQRACDFSYVSNAAQTPESLRVQMEERWTPHASWLQLLRNAGEMILAQSGNGKTWEYVALKNLVRNLALEIGVALEEAPWREMTSDLNIFADRCFRHTTLGWVSEWCQANGRTLRLYGRGWENHPTLACHAAGIAEPGEQARAIYQSTKINLQLIEPGFIHSRALDGLAAGGFFLTRSTPTDGLKSPAVKTLYELARYTVENGIDSDGALEAVRDPHVQSIIAATKAYFLSHEVRDPMWRSLQVWAKAPAAAMLFQRLGEITFHDRESFGRLATRFLNDDKARLELAADMRQLVEKQFSYSARWKTFLDAVHEGLGNAARLSAGEARAASIDDPQPVLAGA